MRKQNVFDEIGFSPEESSALYIKSKLHSKIVHYAKRYSQAQLQVILDEPQSRVSDLMRGKIAKFSLDKLVAYANALHMRPEIKIHEPVATLVAARA